MDRGRVRGIRVGVIGFGRMGALHAQAVSRHPAADLVAVCDIESDARKRARAKHAVPACARLEDFLAIPMEAVVIASNTRNHADHIRRCAEAGVAVFTEKPVALSMEEADIALSTVVQANVPFQINYQRRWDERYLRMRSAIEAGDIGEPLLFKAHGRDPSASAVSNWGLERNGGLFTNCAIHDYDAARFLLGREATSVSATGAAVAHRELEQFHDIDTCSTVMTFDGGAIALTEWTRFASYGYDVASEVIGTHGVVGFGSSRPGIVTLRRRPSTAVADVVQEFGSAFRNAIGAFIDAICVGSTPHPGVEDARAALLIALLARQSYEARSVRVDIPALQALDGVIDSRPAC